MNFHEHSWTMYDDERRTPNLPFIVRNYREYYSAMLKWLSTQRNEPMFWTMIHQVANEFDWYDQVRPYYKVYPSITQSLLKLKLDIPSSSLAITPRCVAIRFANGYEPRFGEHQVSSGLIAFGSAIEERPILFTSWKLLGGSLIVESPRRFDVDGRTLEWWLSMPTDGFDIGTNSRVSSMVSQDFTAASLRMAVTILLLADDPELIKAETLAADRQKYEQSGDQKYVEKAKRRGIVGWSIGREYETCPHIRRPHFALRHTGTGRTVPRIVPVKGSVVHKSKLTQVPTGYVLPDGREIEV